MLVREIEVFRTLMQAGTTSKAAQVLGITQPAVSQSIKRLELQADFALFERLRGRLYPTPEAKALLVEVDSAFLGLANIEHRIRSLKRLGVNTLSIACYPALGLGLMPRVLARLARERPDLATRPQISMQILSSREVRDRVLSTQVDFGLMADEMPTAGLDHSVFAQFNGVVVMHPMHRFVKQALVQLSQLDGEPFLALNPEDSTRISLEQELKNRGIRPAIQVESPYSISICQLAMHGLGVGVVNPAAALEFSNSGLAVRRLEIDIPFTSLLVMASGRPLSSLAKLLLSLMRIQLAEDKLHLKQLLDLSEQTINSSQRKSYR